MGFQATMQCDHGIATIRMSGELDGEGASQLSELVSGAAGRPDLGRLVLLVQELTYLSSAGLRSLVFAHQKMPYEVDIVVVGAQPQVAETIRMTGFDHSVVMQESAGA
jgi:anti-anti-sigma factor